MQEYLMQKDLHEVQASILRELIFHNGTNFASLNKTGITNDHFTFHLKRLISEGIVEKKGKLYYLTQAGKTYASKLDVDRLVMERQGSIGVAVTAKKIIKGKVHYLMQQRLKEPFYGYYGFINGKIRFGETSVGTAKRELKEETGITGTPEVICVYHKMRGPSVKEISLDNFFVVYLVKNPRGKLVDTKEGKNGWYTESEIRKLQTFPHFESVLDAIIGEKFLPYWEEVFKLEKI